MTARNPAARGKRDSNHKAIAEAIRLLGFPVMDLSAAGNGVEDLLVGLRLPDRRWNGSVWVDGISYRWVVVECKVARSKRGEATASQFTKKQAEWRWLTEMWPRITVTSAQDAVEQIRGLTG